MRLQDEKHILFKTVRILSGRKTKRLMAKKDKYGIIHTKPGKVLDCWKQQLSQHLNTHFPHGITSIHEILEAADSNNNEDMFILEVTKVVNRLKYRIAPGSICCSRSVRGLP